MSDPQILNLDDLTATAAKAVVLNHRRHFAREQTVEGYIDAIKRSRDQKRDASADEQVEEAIAFLRDLFPTLQQDELRKLELRKLGALIEFALRPPEDIAAQVESQAAQNKQGEDAAGNA